MLQNSYLNKKYLSDETDLRGIIAFIRGKIYQARIEKPEDEEISRVERNLQSVIRSLTVENCNEICMQNILFIASEIQSLLRVIPQAV